MSEQPEFSEELLTLGNTINDLVKEATAKSEEAKENQHVAVYKAILAGRNLLVAKEQSEHGQWLPYLEYIVDLPNQRAGQWMKLANAHKTIESPEDVKALDIRSVNAALRDANLTDNPRAKPIPRKGAATLDSWEAPLNKFYSEYRKSFQDLDKWSRDKLEDQKAALAPVRNYYMQISDRLAEMDAA